MDDMGETFRIDAGALGTVTGIRYRPAERTGLSLLLAHGAGADQRHEFMVGYATALAARGIDVATFNFAYTEALRRTPDRTAQLEACFVAAISAFRAQADLAGQPLFIGGKSMGGRMATHLAARDDEDLRLAGVVALGYPLHPPDDPKKLRVEHLPHLRVPTLFVQGTRDEFGGPDELRPHLAGVPVARLYVVEGGDHSFKVLKRQGTPQDEVHARVQDEVARFLREVAGPGAASA